MIATVVRGVNRLEDGKVRIISCASYTTNCITPLVEVMEHRRSDVSARQG